MIKFSKLNNKGFMLAEVVITSSVIAASLVTIFIAVNKVKSTYEKRNRYYDLDAQQIAIETNKALERGNCFNGEYGLVTTNNNIVSVTDQKITEENICDNNYEPQDALIINFTDSYVYFVPTSMIGALASKTGFSNVSTSGDYITYLTNTINNPSDYKYLIVVELKKDNNYYYYALKVGDNND